MTHKGINFRYAVGPSPIESSWVFGIKDHRSQSELRPHYPNQFRHYPFTITYIPIANFTCLGRSFDRFLYVLPLDSSIYISPSVSICHRSYLVPCTWKWVLGSLDTFSYYSLLHSIPIARRDVASPRMRVPRVILESPIISDLKYGQMVLLDVSIS